MHLELFWTGWFIRGVGQLSLKSILITGAAAGALLSSTAAQGNETYVSVFGGSSSVDTDFSVGSFSTRSVFNEGSYKGTRIFGGNAILGALTKDLYSIRATYVERYALTYNYSFFSTVVSGFNEDLDNGFVVGAALGLDFMDGWRAELEASYRSYDVGGNHRVSGDQYYGSFYSGTLSFVGFLYLRNNYGVTVKSGLYTSGNPYIQQGSGNYIAYSGTFTQTISSDGDLSSFALMANVWLDFDLGEEIPLTPFIGAGLGMARLEASYRTQMTLPANTVGYSYTRPSFSVSYRAEDDAWVFAWQAGAGLAYQFGNGMSLSAQYRYFSTGDVDLPNQSVNIDAHEVLIGLSIPLGEL